MYEKRAFSANGAAYSDKLRAKLSEAEALVRCIAPSLERSLALTKLDEAMFWADAAILAEDHETKVDTRIDRESTGVSYETFLRNAGIVAADKHNDSVLSNNVAAEQAEQVRAMNEAEQKRILGIGMEKEIRIEVPKEIRTDMAFDLSATIDRARTNAIDDFIREAMIHRPL